MDRVDRAAYHRPRTEEKVGRRVVRALGGAALAVTTVVAFSGPAWADEGQSPDEGYVIVLQALSYLANEPGAAGTTEALTKVDEALTAKDQDGVNLAEVVQARSALRRGETAAGRSLLQKSITDAVAALKPAIGEQTGTKVMLGPFPGRGPLSVTGWVFLTLSLLVAAAGVWLAALLRPRENLKDLSRDILASQELSSNPATASTERHNHVDQVD